MPYKEPNPGEEIVITGISGVYPQCENISVLAQKLFAKEDLITDLPQANFSAGKLKSVNKFDAGFFSITNEHAEYMDPLCRILLEKTYEAISDAGYSYLDFKNTNTAVYVANCTSDAEVESTFRTDVKGALICERAQSFLANRISYWLGAHGPSCTVNTACSSSLYALEFAYTALRRGECEAAIIGGSNLCMAPGMVRLYKNLGITSSRCRSFDDKAIGFCRSEAISAVLLQKAKHARRIYAEVIHIKTNNDGYKKQSILFPSHLIQSKLINEVYEECDVPKNEVSWVEAHGTGTRVGDYQEMKSLQTLCDGRVDPLLAGCVKSNLGHTEATSGLCSIAKAIIAMETGFIPPNLHFTSPQNGIEALQTGKIQIITEKTSWAGGYVAINNFGIGGSNAHLLLKSNSRKYNNCEDDKTPRLVTISGRTAESVDSILTYLHSNPINIEFIGLLHRVFSLGIPSHEFRSYTIVDQENGQQIKQIQHIKPQKRPIWFIYPGMGSQWISMGRELMALHEFEKSITECHNILKPYGLHLLQILTDTYPDTFKNIINCFVGITAFMIALTDLLTSIKLEPNGLIGHSFGEIICGYADKCLSKKQALLAAYYRGLASTETNTIKALMAVIGLGGERVRSMCPNAVEVVCFNGSNSCTIAGPEDVVKNLIKEFRKQNVFANEVFSDNIAYHSTYLQSAGSVYENYLYKLIPAPQKRSSKWISTSISEINWGTAPAEFCSAEYFRNNFTSPVLLENSLKHIPNDAIVIEIAPHSLFKTVLNETLNESIVNVSLMNKHHSKPLVHFLSALGRLYNYNVDLDISKLYPPLAFPVSRGTPMISPLIRWNHEKDWYVPFEAFDPTSTKNEHSVTISYENEDSNFLHGCIVDGKNLFPESGFLTDTNIDVPNCKMGIFSGDARKRKTKDDVHPIINFYELIKSDSTFAEKNLLSNLKIMKMAWELFAEKKKVNYQDTSVIFKNVKFHKVVEIPKNGKLNFDVALLQKNGDFEITLKDEVIVNGYIEILTRTDEKIEKCSDIRSSAVLKLEDIYQDLRIKGYHYENQFQTLLSSNLEGTNGTVTKTENWVLFLNSLIQFLYLSSPTPNLQLVDHIGTLEIDLLKHSMMANDEQRVPVRIKHRQIESGGVRLTNVNLKTVGRNPVKAPLLQTIDFISYSPKQVLPVQKIIRTITTIVLENCLISRMNIIEIIDSTENSKILSTHIHNHFQQLPFYKIDVTLNSKNQSENIPDIPPSFTVTSHPIPSNNTHLLILPESTNESEILKNVTFLAENGFFLLRQKTGENDIQLAEFYQFAVYNVKDAKLTLWHKKPKHEIHQVLRVSHENLDWIQPLQTLLEDHKYSKIILYSDNYTSGIIGFFNCLRKENRGHDLRCFLILDQTVLPFDLNTKFYENQLKYDLAINVYVDGHWGCYVPNIFRAPDIMVPHICLRQDLENESFYWTEDTKNFQTETLIDVNYVSLPEDIENFFNFENSPQTHFPIYEFSGRDNSGNKVMGISFSGKIASSVIETDCLYWNIPEGISPHDAAAIPLAYITALHFVRSKTEGNGDTMLIQHASSHYGQALLTIALGEGYSVYTIENHKEEIEFIQTHFPQVLKCFSAKEPSEITELQTLADRISILVFSKYQSYTHELLQIIKHKGKVIFIGQEERNIIILIDQILQRNLLFQRINPIHLFDDFNALDEIKDSFKKILQNGWIKPFYQKPIEMNTIQELKGNNAAQCKTVLKVPKAEPISSKTNIYKTKPRFTCSPNETVIISGGLGGMGFELANWLSDRGAKKLILVSRTGFCNGYKQKKISQLKRRGVTILISTDNVATYEGATNLLETANELGPVSAIFNTALVLQDSAFENQTKESFQMVANPKARATVILDKLSRTMCPNLRHFVVFSSIACGYGNAGQTNYGYANSVMERICEKRRLEGLPGLAIEWAGVADVGYLENQRTDRMPVGTQLQPIRSCLNVLDEFLFQRVGIVTSFIVADQEVITTTTTSSIFKTIRKIIEKSELTISKETTLEEIGVDSIAVAETKNILEQKCNVFLNAKEILKIQVHALWDMEKKCTMSSYQENETIKKISILEEVYSNFFEIITKEKNSFALESVIRLPSFLHYGATTEVPVTTERTIFFFPSIEGFGAVMQPLAKNIDFQVLSAQYNMRDTSIRQITRILLPEVEKRLTSAEPFHILGYSFGGLIAMEIVHELEKRGRTGYIYLIDSSPSIIKWFSRVLYRDQGFVTNSTAFVRALRAPIDMKKFDLGLRRQETWEAARAFIKKSLPDNLPLTKEHLDTILNTVQERINDIESYNGIPKKSLISKMFFFKPKEQIFQPSVQFDLQEFCNQSMQEFTVDGNHFTILKSEVLAYYIMNLYKN